MSKRISASDLGILLLRLLRDRSGVEAVEFALIAPVLLAITLGVVETSLLLYDYHLAGEATRRGVRTAVIVAPIAVLENIKNEDVVCASDTDDTVNCTGGELESEASFNTVLASMQRIMPSLSANNLRISYAASGVASDETAGIATPLVSVALVNVVHSFMLGDLLPGVPSEITFPPFSTTALAPSIDVPTD